MGCGTRQNELQSRFDAVLHSIDGSADGQYVDSAVRDTMGVLQGEMASRHRAEDRAVGPPPATHSILTELKAGETAYYADK